MRKLVYSPDAKEKLKNLKAQLKMCYGEDKAKEIIQDITRTIRKLQEHAEMAPSVHALLGISCEYRMLYIQHNYAFYVISDEAIRIVDIYNEREDFMWKLFGIKTTTQETEDYWKE